MPIIGNISSQAGRIPGTPTITGVTAGDGEATVSFNLPAYKGKTGTATYVVTSSPGGFSATSSGSPVVVPGLTNGTAYTFTVRAQGAGGVLGAASSASASVTPAPAFTATGGTIITSGGYKYHVFTANGTFSRSSTTEKTVECLVIGGGGSGGEPGSSNGAYGGGGGAGEIAYTSNLNSSYISTLNVPVVIGAGGANEASGTSSVISDEFFNSYSEVTGHGGGCGGGSLAFDGSSGASGGGGAAYSDSKTGYAGGNALYGGYSGAAGSEVNAGGNMYWMGGGGGGAGAAGSGPNGGNGSSTYSSWAQATSTGEEIVGTATYYYAGGGGGAHPSGPYSGFGIGGYGGAGNGADVYGDGNAGVGYGEAATANTGSGGGGAAYTISSPTPTAGAGGSGLVIFRYAV